MVRIPGWSVRHLPDALSEAEIASWRQHPDTYFGIPAPRTTKTNSPLEFYDAIHGWFKRESKDRLLEAMAGAPDYDQISTLDHPRLASLYSERMTQAAFAVRPPDYAGSSTDPPAEIERAQPTELSSLTVFRHLRKAHAAA